jgi:hypothetical protein
MRGARLLALIAAGCAQHQSLDLAEAGPDLALQGEYAAAGADFAAQVIALGDGRFRALLLGGGLAGDGWDGRTPIELEGGAGELEGEGYVAELRRGSMRLRSAEAKDRWVLRRVRRESPTLGAAPPAGARVLFGGSGTPDFQGRVDERGRLEAGATSRTRLRDFRLHLEFLVPFAPRARGQARGNSGVYLQGRYEVQVLDSFGLEPAEDGCGALYGQRAPDLNMALPPLTWQTYDIEFRAARFDPDGARLAPARVSVRHNGVPIHRDVELAGPTRGGEPEGPESGPIHLQDHRSPVRYRNVWVQPIEPEGEQGD